MKDSIVKCKRKQAANHRLQFMIVNVVFDAELVEQAPTTSSVMEHTCSIQHLGSGKGTARKFDILAEPIPKPCFFRNPQKFFQVGREAVDPFDVVNINIDTVETTRVVTETA